MVNILWDVISYLLSATHETGTWPCYSLPLLLVTLFVRASLKNNNDSKLLSLIGSRLSLLLVMFHFPFYLLLLFLILTREYVPIDFWERGKEKGGGGRREGERDKSGGRGVERQRERERGEKHWLVASCALCLNLQTGYVPWQGIKPETFQCMGWCSNQPNHIGQGNILNL